MLSFTSGLDGCGNFCLSPASSTVVVLAAVVSIHSVPAEKNHK